MSQALQLAETGRYTVSPNPMVGCLLVKDGTIIGRGAHQKAGDAHAEIIALNEAGHLAKGAEAYVTLEPCCHFGRTPPCTDALIKAGVRKVNIATSDPNALVQGRGVEQLRKAGIEVEIGLLKTKAQQLNEIFFYATKYQRPFVLSKWAMSLDGKTITHPDDTRYISSAIANTATHDLRRAVDAILIGSHTAKQDNPTLIARDAKDCPHTKQPARIVLTTRGCLPLNLKILDQQLPGKTIIATTEDADPSWRQAISEKNIEFMLLPKNTQGQIHLPSLLDALFKRNITSLLVEGGMTVHESFFNENLVNKVQVTVAPVIIGSLSKKKRLENITISKPGQDIHVIGKFDTLISEK